MEGLIIKRSKILIDKMGAGSEEAKKENLKRGLLKKP